MLKKSKILGIVITDGVGFRNYVMSDFLLHASQNFEKVIVYSGLPVSAFSNIQFNNIEFNELDVFTENKITWFFRKWKEIAHLRRYSSYFGMKNNLENSFPKNNSPRSLLIKLIFLTTKFLHSGNSILFAEKVQFLSFANNSKYQSYKKLIAYQQPDLIFFTHQRPPYLAPFLSACINLKIETCSFIFSWDNLSSKGRMLGTFDNFLVWSDLMKKEMLYFYPNVSPQNILVVGTPQFEPYVLPRFESSKLDFLLNFNLDENKKIICYSCADISIGQNDALIISTIAQAIIDGHIDENTELLVRTSPAEGDRFVDVRKQYPNIKWNIPKWILTRSDHAESWSQRIPAFEDIKDLRAILSYSDLNVNMCSTMSLDFMLFDKPVINTVFGNEKNGLFDDQKFLNYDHFKKVVESGSVQIAKNKLDLIAQINATLKNPEQQKSQRKAMIELQISKPLYGTSERIATTLLHIANA